MHSGHLVCFYSAMFLTMDKYQLARIHTLLSSFSSLARRAQCAGTLSGTTKSSSLKSSSFWTLKQKGSTAMACGSTCIVGKGERLLEEIMQRKNKRPLKFCLSLFLRANNTNFRNAPCTAWSTLNWDVLSVFSLIKDFVILLYGQINTTDMVCLAYTYSSMGPRFKLMLLWQRENVCAILFSVRESDCASKHKWQCNMVHAAMSVWFAFKCIVGRVKINMLASRCSNEML